MGVPVLTRFLPHAFLLLALLAASVVPAFANTDDLLKLEQGWEYRWGDSPVGVDGIPEWVRSSDPADWQAIGFPSNPPGREGREHAWFRVTLPEGEWQDPVLYIFSVDIIVQVWLNNELIYQYGTFDAEGRGRFEGWPWHEIPLPGDFQGQTAYFRVFSNYTDIGLWGEVGVLDHAQLVLRIIQQSAEGLIVAALTGLIGLLALVFALIQRKQRSFASIALFGFAASAMLVAESQASLLVLYRPLFWDYLAAGSYYMIPVALALLLQQWLSGQGPTAARWLWKLHLVYVVGALGLSAMGWVDLSSTFPPFDALLMASLLILMVSAARRFRGLAIEQRLLLATFAVFSVFLILDMAVAHGVLPWGRVPVSWGALGFSLAIISIAVWHYSTTHQALYTLTAQLEQKVAERTARAEGLAQREAARASLLSLESRKNETLFDLISTLQDSASVDEAFRRLSSALPDLYLPVAGCFYQHQPDGRYTRLVTWGELDDRFPEKYGTAMLLPADTPALIAVDQAPDQLSFRMRLETAQPGAEPAGLLLLARPALPELVQDYSLVRLIGWVQQSVEKIAITLSALMLREELRRFSYEDGLTGLKNRRHFDELFGHEKEVSLRTGRPLSLLMFDLDHFKQFNDDYGHEAGDEALRHVGRLLDRHFRGSDVVCRYGGEEFVVLMPGAPLAEALLRAETLRKLIADEPVVVAGQPLTKLTISGGVACWPDTTDQFDSLMRAADAALYKAKRAGRNRVEAAGQQQAVS